MRSPADTPEDMALVARWTDKQLAQSSRGQVILTVPLEGLDAVPTDARSRLSNLGLTRTPRNPDGGALWMAASIDWTAGDLTVMLASPRFGGLVREQVDKALVGAEAILEAYERKRQARGGRHLEHGARDEPGSAPTELERLFDEIGE